MTNNKSFSRRLPMVNYLFMVVFVGICIKMLPHDLNFHHLPYFSSNVLISTKNLVFSSKKSPQISPK